MNETILSIAIGSLFGAAAGAFLCRKDNQKDEKIKKLEQELIIETQKNQELREDIHDMQRKQSVANHIVDTKKDMNVQTHVQNDASTHKRSSFNHSDLAVGLAGAVLGASAASLTSTWDDDHGPSEVVDNGYSSDDSDSSGWSSSSWSDDSSSDW